MVLVPKPCSILSCARVREGKDALRGKEEVNWGCHSLGLFRQSR